MTSYSSVHDHLARLVAFDTTSRNSNLDLIAHVEEVCRPHAAAIRRLPNEEGTKANLWVSFGPQEAGGAILSGHTDVVPVDGQPWTSDPWVLTRRDDRLHARGTCDMKGFIALCLAFAPSFARGLRKPVHFAFSFDEEVGCAGVTPMIERIVAEGAAPDLVWVGEPTLWGVVSAHKGIRDVEVAITGKAAHSSDPRLGASAIHEAVELISVLRRIATDAEASAADGGLFDPSWTTLTVGMINGGTAANILARECSFIFDQRAVPGGPDPDAMLAPFREAVEIARARLAKHGPECGVEVTVRADAPPLQHVPDSPAERLLRDLTGDNSLRTAAYATEAGQFQKRGVPAVVCGPGSIEQAHQPDEFVAVSELEKGVEIFGRFLSRMTG
ncbi:MAG: acetylornithine deacetylase [Hyphomonadaceae bacterium]